MNIELIDRLLINEDGSARDRIIGIETEYAVQPTLIVCKDNDQAQRDLLTQVTSEATRLGFSPRQNVLLARNFYEDGDREYIDVGSHPEISTAEDLDFARVAFRVARGHVKVANRFSNILPSLNNTFNQIDGEGLVKKLDIYANTYSPSTHNSWGSHRNYLTRRALEFGDFAPAFAAHNIARITWSGTGRVLPTNNSRGFELALSEKAEDIFEESNSGTTRSRPLVNTRDETLADSMIYRRIHDVSGETVMNPFVNAMTLATGSIVLRACELGVDFTDLLPDNPVKAIKIISHDPSLKVGVILEDGRRLTGLELEEAIALRSLTSALAAEYLTDQELEWGIKWIELLDDMRHDPNDCADRVDWVLKRGHIERALQKTRKQGETYLGIATLKALDYHNVSREGSGMQMMRKAKFILCPSPEQLEFGVGLPPTRASLRGNTIAALIKRNIPYRVGWNILGSHSGLPTLLLNDPYATIDGRLGDFIKELEKYEPVDHWQPDLLES